MITKPSISKQWDKSFEAAGSIMLRWSKCWIRLTWQKKTCGRQFLKLFHEKFSGRQFSFLLACIASPAHTPLGNTNWIGTSPHAATGGSTCCLGTFRETAPLLSRIFPWKEDNSVHFSEVCVYHVVGALYGSGWTRPSPPPAKVSHHPPPCAGAAWQLMTWPLWPKSLVRVFLCDCPKRWLSKPNEITGITDHWTDGSLIFKIDQSPTLT